MHRLLSGLTVLLMLAVAPVHAQSAADLILNLGEETDEAVLRSLAASMAVSGNGLGYRSTQAETRTFSFLFTPIRDTTRLMAFSDDGLDVWIKELPEETPLAEVAWTDADRVLNQFQQPQSLTDISQSLQPLSVALNAGRRYALKIRYSNLGDTPEPSVSGLKLFAYRGGILLEGGLESVVPNPAIVPAGTEVRFAATGTRLEGVQWVASGNPSTSSATGPSLITNWSTPGSYELAVTLNSRTVTVPVSVVKLEQIAARGTSTGRLLPRGTPLMLDAIPGGGARFPTGSPQWLIRLPSGVSPRAESPLRDYPKTGRSIAFVSDLPGTFDLIAACGNTSQVFTVRVSEIALTARPDDYYLPGNSFNETLSESTVLETRGQSGMPADAGPCIAENDGERPFPESVTFELRRGPQYAESFRLDPVTGAFRYKPRDMASHRWIRKTREWATDADPGNDELVLEGQPPQPRFHGDSFVYRLKSGQGADEVTSSDTLVRIFPPRQYGLGRDTDSEAPSLGGLALVGGGEGDFDRLFWWLVSRAPGGDIVILKTSGDPAALSDELQSLTPAPNSVTTLVLQSRLDANRADWAQLVNRAEAIYLLGDDAARWIALCRGTPLGQALTSRAATWSQPDGCAVAGSNAGLQILGSIDYTAARGVAVSSVVLRNPRHLTVSEIEETPGSEATGEGVRVFEDSFLNVLPGLHEPALRAENRMGRWLVLLAKSRLGGIAVDERTAWVIEPGQPPRVLDESLGAVYEATPPQGVDSSRALQAETTVTRRQLQPPNSQTYTLHSRDGVLSSDAEGGQIYGTNP